MTQKDLNVTAQVKMSSTNDSSNPSVSETKEWEVCKENIQPLKQGRIMSNLQAALSTESSIERKKLIEQKE